MKLSCDAGLKKINCCDGIIQIIRYTRYNWKNRDGTAELNASYL